MRIQLLSITISAILLGLTFQISAQVSINADNSLPDPSAGLDVNFTNKGFLPPRIALTSTNMATPVVSPAAGLLVYNTATAGTPPDNVVAGYYYWDGAKWVSLVKSYGLNNVPALSQAQIDTLIPVVGSVVLNTSTNCLNYFTLIGWMTLCGNSVPPPPPPPLTGNLTFAPYVDCCLWPNFAIQNVSETGISLYTCAFIVDDQSAAGANPCWGGYSTLGMDYYLDKISSLRSQGGDIIMSFGGASGTELAYAASNEFAARDAYKTVIDAYDLTSIDFDIEGFLTADPPSIVRRSKAMKLLQAEYPSLKISLTLPVLPEGLTNNGLNVVQSAIDEDVDLFCLNIMAMDYGPSGIDMGDAAISAGEAVFQQLKTIYQNSGANLADSVIWRKIGVTPMIGLNDVQGEVFYLDDAADLAAWAVEKKINRLSLWSVNRDRQCVNPGDPLYSCSHINQQLYEFSGIFGGVAATP